MSLFVPVAQPSGVGPTGITVEIDIPAGYRQRRIARVVAAHQAGSLNQWALVLSTDPACADPLARVVGWRNQRPLQTVDDDNRGLGFAWAGAETQNWSTAGKALYAQFVPDAGSDNSFVVGIHVDEVA